jgi:steroid delta-isomerase-like uncharacterized protein
MNQLTSQLLEKRLSIVNEHIAAEEAHDVERTLKTFHTPHYWVRPLGAETTGAAAVAELLATLFQAFPDFKFEPARTHHAADAVIMEGRMSGTHRGPWAGVPASGKPIDVMTCCIYHFEGDRLVSESVYFDHATLLAQIGIR